MSTIDNSGENLQDKNHDDDLENDNEELDNHVLDFDLENDVDIDEDDGTVTIKKDDYDKLSESVKNVKTTVKQKKHWREKATQGTKPKEPVNPSSKPNMSDTQEQKNNNEENKVPSNEIKPATQTSNDAIEKVSKDVAVIKLTNDYPYLKDVAEEIIQTAQQLNKPVAEILESKFYKPFVEEKRKEHELQNASLSGNGNSGSSVNTGQSKDWSQASAEEVKAHRREIEARSRR